MDHFDAALFDFLADLRRNNTREWFEDNKQRYAEDVKEPMLEFIAAFAGPLAEISPHFLADPRPNGGSMFRIYRDVRFSRDKSPYKTHAAAQFRHREGRDVHAPGFYLHLEPGRVFMGAGLWRPPGPTLNAVRSAIIDDPDGWQRARTGLALGGDSLIRAPRGVDPDHPMIEDLKRKDFVSMEESTQESACREGFLDQFVSTCRRTSPLVAYLTEAVGLAY
jgi:uncharacterized protein (TIGR02453 family)